MNRRTFFGVIAAAFAGTLAPMRKRQVIESAANVRLDLSKLTPEELRRYAEWRERNKWPSS